MVYRENHTFGRTAGHAIVSGEVGRCVQGRDRDAGFTVIELLIVAALIGSMSMIIIPRALGYTERTKVMHAMADIQMMDADIFDGHTNGKGWALFGAKQIYAHTDLKLTLFIGEALDDDITWERAVANSDRVRLQTDIVVKF